MEKRCLCAIALACCACSPKADNAAAPTHSVRAPLSVGQIHSQMIIPASDALYAAESDAPATDGAWAAIQAAAQKLIDGARLLESAPKAQADPQWLRISKAVEDGGSKSLTAVKAHNVEALQAADGEFTAQCEDCHKFFRDIGGGMMAKPKP